MPSLLPSFLVPPPLIAPSPPSCKFRPGGGLKEGNCEEGGGSFGDIPFKVACLLCSCKGF